MQRSGARWLLAGLLIGAGLLVGACASRDHHVATDEELNVYPANYKADIAAAMHAYLNDPTGIRDAAVSEPALKSGGMTEHPRYTVCLRFNPKKSAGAYQGVKEVAAVFLAGRFDRFVETPHELCAGANYAPFPELEKLTQ